MGDGLRGRVQGTGKAGWAGGAGGEGETDPSLFVALPILSLLVRLGVEITVPVDLLSDA